jgi:hypothetical protein
MIRRFALIACLLMTAVPLAKAQVVFSQNFNSSTTLSDYFSGTPNSGQANAISTANASNFLWSINGSNQLLGDRTASTGAAFSRSSDLSISPNVFYFQFDFNLLSTATSETTALTLQFGSGFGTANSVETNANTHSRFGINWVDGATDGWQVRDIGGNTNSATFTGSHTITFISNNSGASTDYIVSGSISGTVANDTFDLWVDSTQVFDDRAVTTASLASVTDFKLVWGGSAVSQATFDNIVLAAVPEPGSMGLCAAGCVVLGLWRRRTERRGVTEGGGPVMRQLTSRV